MCRRPYVDNGAWLRELVWVGGCVTAPAARTSPGRWRGSQPRAPWYFGSIRTAHHGGHGAVDIVGPVAPPGHARGLGNAGVYTNRRKWPLGAVLGHLCTLLRLARAARVAPPLGWRLCRDSNPHKPRGARYGDWASTRDPSAQGSVAFSSSGASGASRDAPGSLSGPYRTTSTTLSHRTYPAHMRAKRTIVETLLSTLNLMNSQNPRWRSVQSLRAMLAPLPCEAPLADSV